MNCRTADRLMSERLDGRLTGAQLKALTDHVAACPRCEEQWRQFERLDALLADWSVAPLPSGLKDRVLAAADAPRKVDPRRSRSLLRWAAAVTIGLALAGTLLLINGRPEPRVAEKEESEFIISPDLPPDVAEWCREFSPAAGEAIMDCGDRLASSLTGASDRLAATSGGMRRNVTRLTDRVLNTHVPLLMKSVNRALRTLELSGEKDGAGRRESTLSWHNGLFAARRCDRCEPGVVLHVVTKDC